MQLYVHLNFGGDCAEAFRFYEQHLGGRVLALVDRSEMPGAPAGGPPFVIHARLALGNTVLIGNDVPPEHFQRIRSAYLFLAVDSSAEAERVHGILSEGGDVTMPLAETFFASRFSQVRDRFGVLWTIIHEKPRT